MYNNSHSHWPAVQHMVCTIYSIVKVYSDQLDINVGTKGEVHSSDTNGVKDKNWMWNVFDMAHTDIIVITEWLIWPQTTIMSGYPMAPRLPFFS